MIRGVGWIGTVTALTLFVLAVTCAEDDGQVYVPGPPGPDARDRVQPEDRGGGIDDQETTPQPPRDVRRDDGAPPPPRCGDGRCEGNENPTTCPEDCAEEGTLSCQMVIVCFQNCCPDRDEACAEACVMAGTAEAQQQLADLFGCIEARCGEVCGAGGQPEQCNACVGTNCRAEIDACDVAPAGRSGCMTLYQCLLDCPDLPQDGSGTARTCPTDDGILCFNECFVDADQTGVDLFFAMNNCVGENCESECGPQGNQQACTTCAQNNCSQEISACQRDR